MRHLELDPYQQPYRREYQQPQLILMSLIIIRDISRKRGLLKDKMEHQYQHMVTLQPQLMVYHKEVEGVYHNTVVL